MNIIVKRRIGPDPHEGGRQSSSSSGCPDILELDSGDFAIIGQDITAAAIPALPASAGCAVEERVIRIPREFCFAPKATSLALREIAPLLPSSPHSVTKQGVGIFVEWFGANWFNLLQTVAIVSGLFFTGRSFLVDTRIRRISNLLNITEHHRSIWQQVIDKPNLLRVLSAEAKLDIKPITLEERIFVNLIILHLTAVMAAIKGRVHEQPAGQDEDLREFFSLPIPNKVWKDSKRFR